LPKFVFTDVKRIEETISSTNIKIISYIEFNIETLEFKIQFKDLCWLYSLLNSKIERPEILSLIYLNIPTFSLRFELQ